MTPRDVLTRMVDQDVDRDEAIRRLQGVLSAYDWTPVASLAEDLLRCWKGGNPLFRRIHCGLF